MSEEKKEEKKELKNDGLCEENHEEKKELTTEELKQVAGGVPMLEPDPFAGRTFA